MNSAYTSHVTSQPTITVSNATGNKTRGRAVGAGSDRGRAIEQVYEAHVESIYKFIFFKVGNREDAEDITSQVFIKAAHSLDVAQDERTILAWLYQVARTTITDHWRQFYKGPTTSLDAAEETKPLHLAADDVILGDAGGDEGAASIERVNTILQALPENYRTVLHFRFLKGYSLKETAQAMGTTEANVKVLQHRALQKAVKLGETFGL